MAAPAGAGSVWSITPSPNKVLVKGRNDLSGVSCVSATFCVAVGDYLHVNAVGGYTLIESWNGTSWSITPSPNSTSSNLLQAVSCVSSAFCVAVGYNLSGPGLSLIESWNGTSWSVTPGPSDGSLDPLLNGVSCVSSTLCKAVGQNIDPITGRTVTLIESWNGSKWSITPGPNRTHGDAVLYGVSCVSSAACQAVGGYTTTVGGVIDRTLIESWNGTTWSISASPNSGTSFNDLFGVSCVAVDSCQAVGRFGHGAAHYNRTLVESWDGTSWSITPSPNGATPYSSTLLGVSCATGSSCQAVGTFNTGSIHYRTLIESWNGTSWTISNSSNTGSAMSDSLDAVSCAVPASCEAVGEYFTSAKSTRTLVESNG
jgi:hypothetical protein